MASYKDLAAADVEHSSLDSTAADTTLATMQADMNAALKDRQNNSASTQLNKASDVTKGITVPSVNEAGERVLDEAQVSRVIEMAWEDRTPFGAIEHSYGLTEPDVIKLMRQALKPSSFKLWRERVTNRATKHQAKREFEVGRAYCKTQYKPR